jgi:hypothetical protein
VQSCVECGGKLKSHVGATAVSFDSSTATSGTSFRGANENSFSLCNLFIMASLELVTSLSLVPGDVAIHAVLMFACMAAEQGHFFAADMNLSRFALGRHL